MNTAVLDTPNSRTQRSIEAFKNRFGRPHFVLACHAALPLSFTPELLYGLWVNFQQDCQGEMLDIPWIAASDLLLSEFCDEVGHQLYEMDRFIRNELVRQLREDPAFGARRVEAIAQFVSSYVDEQAKSDDPDIRDFAQAQQWTALAYTQSEVAAKQLALALSHAYQNDRDDLLRLALIVEALEDPLADFPQLLAYARGMAHLARGDIEAAKAEFEKMELSNRQLGTAGVTLAIPLKTERASKPIKRTPLKFRMPRHYWLTASALSVVAWVSVILANSQPSLTSASTAPERPASELNTSGQDRDGGQQTQSGAEGNEPLLKPTNDGTEVLVTQTSDETGELDPKSEGGAGEPVPTSEGEAEESDPTSGGGTGEPKLTPEGGTREPAPTSEDGAEESVLTSEGGAGESGPTSEGGAGESGPTSEGGTGESTIPPESDVPDVGRSEPPDETVASDEPETSPPVRITGVHDLVDVVGSEYYYDFLESLVGSYGLQLSHPDDPESFRGNERMTLDEYERWQREILSYINTFRSQQGLTPPWAFNDFQKIFEDAVIVHFDGAQSSRAGFDYNHIGIMMSDKDPVSPAGYPARWPNGSRGAIAYHLHGVMVRFRGLDWSDPCNSGSVMCDDLSDPEFVNPFEYCITWHGEPRDCLKGL